MLSVHSKRATMDFSLLTVPSVPERALQSSSSLQVQNTSLLHTVPPRSVPSGNDSVCVCAGVCVDALNSKPLLCQEIVRLCPVYSLLL